MAEPRKPWIIPPTLRDVPGYSLKETAYYFGLPASTVRLWARGQAYPTQKYGRRQAEPLFPIAQQRPPLLSFWNLVEVYVLATIRRVHEVPMPRLRSAIDFLMEHPKFRLDRPLLQQELLTDGIDLFVENLQDLIVVSRGGRTAVRELIRGALTRIEHDPKGLAIRLFPWRQDHKERRAVETDPGRAFGRMVIAGTGIPIQILSERFHSGDSIDALANDYHLDRDQVEEAIRWDWRAAA